jgi:methylglutaconyl-CoA hydratase
MAKELLFTGKTINAREAKKIGLINQVVGEGDLDSAVDKIFTNIRNNSSQALNQTKQILQQQEKLNIESILEKACEFNTKSREMDDFKEGLNSFLEKRKPRWGNNST